MMNGPDSRTSTGVAADDSRGPGTTIACGELILDLEARTARYHGRRIDLTRLEFALLATLARHPGWVFSKERLLELVWGYDFGDARTVSVHMANLRAKLGKSAHAPRYIHTAKGAGYKLEIPAPAPIRLSSPPLPSGPLVGRDDELTSLHMAWQSVRRDLSGRALLLSGEAGIGKTRLAQEIAFRLQQAGAATLWGRSYEAEGSPAYLPWMQIVEGCLQGEAGATIIRELGRHQQPLARICPELLLEGPGQIPPVEESAEARFRLFDAVASFLDLAAKHMGPLLVILDDVHDADAGSLALLSHLARQLEALPVLLVACYRRGQTRENPSLRSALASLAHEGLGEQLDLGGLDERRVAQLLEILSGRTSSAALAARVWDETQGNPFFVTQIARLLLSQGALDVERGPFPELPDGVKAIIRRRLAALDPQTQRLLEVASVAGREFSFALLERVMEQDCASLLESLAEATDAQLIEHLRGGHHFRFVHNLLRQDLYTSLELADRVRLHGQIGDALVSLNGARTDAHLEELAHHYLEASPLGWRDKALDFRIRAARAALNRYAWEDAGRHFEQALAVLSLLPAEDLESGMEVEIWEGLGDTRFITEGYEDARRAYREALARGSRETPPTRARLLRKIARTYKEQRLFGEALEALTAAEKELGPATPGDDVLSWREWLDCKLELLDSRYYSGGDAEVIGQLLAQIEPVMERYASPLQLVGFLRARIPYCLRRDGGGTSDECLGYAKAYLSAARAADIPAHIAFAETMLCAVMQMRPDLTETDRAEADKHGQIGLRLGEEIKDMQTQMIALANLSINARLRRDTEQARHWAKTCAQRTRSGGWPDMAAFGVANLAWLDLVEGNREGARQQAKQALTTWELVPAMPYTWVARFPLLAVELEEGGLPEAAEQARQLLEPHQRRLPETLTHALQTGVASAEEGNWEVARAQLETAVDLAVRYRFL